MMSHTKNGRTGSRKNRSGELLAQKLQVEGISNPEVLQAIANSPRHIFLPEILSHKAYDNTALPIGQGQTISQPYIVAKMSELLLKDYKPKNILEIGTGSGYQTSILAQLTEKVFSVERIKSLQFQAKRCLRAIDLHNISMKHGDGWQGWPSKAPFDAIIVDEVVGIDRVIGFTGALRASPVSANLVVCVLTSKMQKDRGESLLAAGVDAYLSRPIREYHLRLSIEKLVSQRRQQQTVEFITPFTFSEQKGDSLETSEGTIRILLAEDNVVNQKVAIRMLQKLGCTVDVAANGREAVRMWKQFPYDLVFMDCHMPVMDGYEATTEIRKNEGPNEHVPIVALTANALEGEAQVCAKVGMDGFVAKPVKITDLESVVNQYAVI